MAYSKEQADKMARLAQEQWASDVEQKMLEALKGGSGMVGGVSGPPNAPNFRNIIGGAGGGGMSGGSGASGVIAQTMQPRRPSALEKATKALMARMGWENWVEHGFQHLYIMPCEEVTFLCVVQDNQAVLIDDRSGMFPCDETVTKLRMLKG